MEQISLTATRREGKGKGAARRLRAAGQVPAVIYGAGHAAENLSVAVAELEKVLRQVSGELAFLSLAVDNQAPRMALLKELQHDHLGRQLVHVDFYEVKPDQKMTLEIGLEFKGEAPGLALGGVLNVATHSMSVRGLLKDIPQTLRVDVSGLDMGQSIHVADLALPPGVEAVYDDNFLVVGCVASAKAEAPAPAEGAEEAAAPPEAKAKAPAKAPAKGKEAKPAAKGKGK